MVDHRKNSLLQQYLLKYYQIGWLRTVNLVMYFVVEILLFLILTFLPIKIVFNWLLQSYNYVQQSVDIAILIIFTLHIYLYLDHKVKKLIQNPQIKKKLLFQNRIIKLKWLSLVTPQLIYDVLCLFVAIYEILQHQNNFTSRFLQLIYLPKIYKIKMFHDRFLTYIIGTSFYIIYNVFYGLFILIIIVSYVGCIFYQIDHGLVNNNYEYPDLLWVVTSAWNDIIGQSFGIQLQYTIYWSLGTASSAAYGNVSASAPQDVIFNIICLYFEGFLFGFYLSRIHSLPEMISKRQNQLLELFQKFQAHNAEIRRNDRSQAISKDLYFKILCSLQYQESRKKSVSEIESILPVNYIIDIKMQIYKELLDLNPLKLWKEINLKRKLSLKITECITEMGEYIYDYHFINKNDLIFLKEGQIQTHLYLDYQLLFPCIYKSGDVFGLFNFITNIYLQNFISKCEQYCNIYVIKREDFKAMMDMEEKIQFQELFNSMITFQNQYALTQSIGKYEHKLNEEESDVLFLNPHRKANYLQKSMSSKRQKFIQKRKSCVRGNMKTNKLLPFQQGPKRNFGTQWPELNGNQNELDVVLIL